MFLLRNLANYKRVNPAKIPTCVQLPYSHALAAMVCWDYLRPQIPKHLHYGRVGNCNKHIKNKNPDLSYVSRHVVWALNGVP